MASVEADGMASSNLRRNWHWFLVIGVIMVFGGLLAMYAPFEASLAVELVIGAFFLAGGIVGIVQTFLMDADWKGRLFYLLISGLQTVAGVLLLFRPLEGLMALTVIILATMFVNGGLRIALGVQSRPNSGWGWLVAGGVVSIAVSAYLFTGYPAVSLVLLGLLVGVSLIVDGIGSIMFAFGVRGPAGEPA